MDMKIQKSSVEVTANILNWLEKNVGETIPSSGSNVNGYGWTIRPNVYDKTYIIELDDNHVDEDTKLLFLLKWS